MSVAELTRRVRFTAAHRYWRGDWTEEHNRSVFGSFASARFHEHDYACDVTVRGEIDQVSGLIIDLAALDEILRAQVRERFDHRRINIDVVEFADGAIVPSTENLARSIFERVERALGDAATLVRVTVREDDSLSATVERER